MEFNLLFTDSEIAVVQLLRHGVKPGVEIEVDERGFFVLHLIECGCLLKLAAQIGELVVAPNFLESKRLALSLVPRVVEVESAGILAAILLRLLFPLPSAQLRRLLLLPLPPASPDPTQPRAQKPASGPACLSRPDRLGWMKILESKWGSSSPETSRSCKVYSLPWSETICTSVVLFATLGLMLIKRLATCPPSKTQSTVSPAKTFATFSSAGSRINVDCKRAARTTGGVSVSDTTTVRGALGASCFGAGVDGPAAEATPAKARPQASKRGRGSFHG